MKNLLSKTELENLTMKQELYFSKEEEYYNKLLEGVPITDLEKEYDYQILETMKEASIYGYPNMSRIYIIMDAMINACYRTGIFNMISWAGEKYIDINSTLEKYCYGFQEETVTLLKSVNNPVDLKQDRVKALTQI